MLRTHTTAATIRALAANPNPPGKFFCVGWTYRNETISFKHLPVFHQVDGIIIDEEANLASLMGTLQEFYSKMGFGRVKFKPAFYPYTEPSVDVVVYMESRGKWIEMGGAGIFRPEVTLPLGCKFPVLAWGLGIERLAMIRFGVSDIRELYGTSLNELEEGAAMPIVNIDLAWLNRLLGKPYDTTRRAARESLEQIGCDVEDVVDIERSRCPQCGSLVEHPLGQDEVKACTICGFESETPFKRAGSQQGDAARPARRSPRPVRRRRPRPRAPRHARHRKRPAEVRRETVRPHGEGRQIGRPTNRATARSSPAP